MLVSLLCMYHCFKLRYIIPVAMAYIRGVLFLVTAWLNIATISRCVVQCQIILIIIILVAKCKNSCNNSI